MSEAAAVAPLPAAAAPPSLAVAAGIDFALALGTVLLLSMLVVLPIVVYGLLAAGVDVQDPRAVEAATQALMPGIVTGAMVAMALAAVVVWALRRNSLRGALPVSPLARSLGFAVVAGVAIQGFALLMGWLMHALGAPIQPSNAEPITDMARQQPLTSWLLVVLVAPLAEELLFRHVLLRRFALAGRALLGLLLTSLLFASLHEVWPGEQGVLAWLAAVLLYVGMGVGFGGVYLRTGRLSAAYVAHATCNLLAMALLAFSQA